MVRAFSLLSASLAVLRKQKDQLINVRFELYGTMLGWPEGSPRHLTEVATEHGVEDLVRETPQRVSYKESIELLESASGALIIGVDDPGYIPSKLFPYAYSGKPLLALVRKDGPAFDEFEKNPGLGHVLWFSEKETMPIEDATRVLQTYLREVREGGRVDRRSMLECHTASSMAAEHAAMFDQCIADHRRQ
jgi:hypothetical protein